MTWRMTTGSTGRSSGPTGTTPIRTAVIRPLGMQEGVHIGGQAGTGQEHPQELEAPGEDERAENPEAAGSGHDLRAGYADQDQQAAWLARYLALSFSNNIERSFWYGWEHFDWGTLYDRTTKQILKPGVAYREVYNWMVGANFSPCTQSGSLYQCTLTRANGYEAKMVWSTGAQVNYTVPTGYVRVKSIDGQVTGVGGGQLLPVGMKPVLVEK